MKFKRLILIPQGLMVLFIVFLSMFAFDVWFEDWSLVEKVIGFLIHLLPSFILLAVLLFSKKYTKITGYIFMLMGLGFAVFFDAYEEWMTFLILVVPLIVCGLLFLLADRFKDHE